MPSVLFRDTGGTNGHIAEPEWLDEFIASLNLPGRVLYRTLRKLPPFQGIPRHVDKFSANPSVHVGARYHLPLVTHPDVLVRWPRDGEEVHMEAGWLYAFDYTREHEVVHRANADRIHLVMNV